MRYSKKEFPPYLFIPGLAQHPEKEGGYLHGKTIDSFDFNGNNFKTNETYLYAIDLFNHDYYWEAHVYWEALWNHVGRESPQGYFLQALIKLAAAGVKDRLNQEQSSLGLVQRALEHLESVYKQDMFGLNKIKLIEQIKQNGYRIKLKLNI